MYDASKYADYRPSLSSDNSAAAALRHEVSSAGQFVVSGRHLFHRGRPSTVVQNKPNGAVDARPPPSVAVAASESRKTMNGASSSSSADVARRRYVGSPLDVSQTPTTASLDDSTMMMSPDSVSTLSSPGDVQPAAGELFSPSTSSSRCRLVSLADEYFPVTLGGKRSTDTTRSTLNGHHCHRRRHSHHRHHRHHNGQGQGQGHARPSSGHSSSSSNSRSSVGCIYPRTTSANGAIVNGTFYDVWLSELTYAV